MLRYVKTTAERNGHPETVPRRIDRDYELVDALRRQQPTAAERLLDTYGDRACRLATRITGSEHDAEEVVQDALWTVVRKIDTFRGDSAFGTWFYRIVANAAYQTLRLRKGRRFDASLDDVLPFLDEHGRPGEPVADWSASVDDPAVQTELRVVLTAAIDELPADYRAIIVLRDVEGLSHREISEVLGISVPNVKSRVHRARLVLRNRLAMYMDGAEVVNRG
jgi:RNA polymerase sigma-70 factor (ECF subfamily)